METTLVPEQEVRKERRQKLRDEAAAVGIIFEKLKHGAREASPRKFDELNEYMAAFWDWPPLEDQGEFNRLFAEYQSEENGERLLARDILVYRNIRLVLVVARRFVPRAKPLLTISDLMQEGVLGLFEAIEGYEASKGRFSTYAMRPIKWAITRAIEDASPRYPFRIPVYVQERVGIVRHAIDAFVKAHQRQPTAVEVLKRIRRWQFRKFEKGELKEPLPIALKDVKRCLRVMRISAIPLDSPMGGKDGEHTVYEVVESKRTPRPDTLAKAREQLEVVTVKLKGVVEAINRLPAREAMVMRFRLGLVPGLAVLTLEEIGARYNLTRQRIQQLETRGVELLAKQGLSVSLDGKEGGNGQRV